MENVGAITFADRLLQPRDSWTEYQQLRLHYIALHELAHMWFGDLVTMQWWTDLWLKESFADFMAATNLSQNKELANYNHSELLFLWYLNRATAADIKSSTHPIQVNVRDTEEAVNVFDSICYEKGASFIKQLSHYVGAKVLTAGMNEYFTKYALKNTELDDFLDCLDNHAQKQGLADLQIKSWAANWLTNAGINNVRADMSKAASGKGPVVIHQEYPELGDKVYQSQKLNLWVAGTNEEGKLVEKTYPYKLEQAETTTVEIDLGEGVTPLACLVNAGNLGYLRTVLDEQQIGFFLKHIDQVKSQLDRSQVWVILAMHVTMCKVNPVSFLETTIRELGKETEQSTLLFVIEQACSFIDLYVDDDEVQSKLSFDLFKMLISKASQIETVTLRGLLVQKALGLIPSAESQPNIMLKLKEQFWADGVMKFADFDFVDAANIVVKEHNMTKAMRYCIVRAVFKSSDATAEEKAKFLEAEKSKDFTD